MVQGFIVITQSYSPILFVILRSSGEILRDLLDSMVPE